MPTIPLLDQQEIARILDRLASQVRERHAHCDQVMLVGIERRGADLARRLAALLGHGLGRPVPLGCGRCGSDILAETVKILCR